MGGGEGFDGFCRDVECVSTRLDRQPPSLLCAHAMAPD